MVWPPTKKNIYGKSDAWKWETRADSTPLLQKLWIHTDKTDDFRSQEREATVLAVSQKKSYIYSFLEYSLRALLEKSIEKLQNSIA
jgi:hypothetical protein